MQLSGIVIKTVSWSLNAGSWKILESSIALRQALFLANGCICFVRIVLMWVKEVHSLIDRMTFGSFLKMFKLEK